MGVRFQPDAREGQAGPIGVSDRFVVLLKRGNARGGKGPDFGNVPAVRTAGDWRKPTTLLNKAGMHPKGQPRPAKGNRGPDGGQPVGEPDAGNPHVRFDEGETWKRSMVELVMPRLTKGPTDRLDLNHRATSLLYLYGDSSLPS